jgi:hypothetical protein
LGSDRGPPILVGTQPGSTALLYTPGQILATATARVVTNSLLSEYEPVRRCPLQSQVCTSVNAGVGPLMFSNYCSRYCKRPSKGDSAEIKLTQRNPHARSSTSRRAQEFTTKSAGARDATTRTRPPRERWAVNHDIFIHLSRTSVDGLECPLGTSRGICASGRCEALSQVEPAFSDRRWRCSAW